jgi:hypothetical protein
MNEYLEWFSQLSEHDKEAVLIKIHLLVEFGPELSRPHADTLHGSKMHNMKELRVKTNGNVYRIAYYFNHRRQGILLTGGNKMAKKMKNAIEAMESMMSPESVQRARMKAEQEILAIKLGQLREKRGLKQNEIDNFSQTSVSRLERRRDIKISTLVEYLNSLGMGLEIKTYPKDKNVKSEEEVLLKI